MPTGEEQDGAKDIKYQGDAILLDNRVTEVERQQTESKKRDEEYKTEQLAINGRMATFTLWLVICTAATGGVAVYQATIARRSAAAAETAANAAKTAAEAAKGTLIEVQKSSRDTHDLAIAAKDQAKAAIGQVSSLQASVKESHALVKATQDSLNAMRSNFIKDQRPYMWIKGVRLKVEQNQLVAVFE